MTAPLMRASHLLAGVESLSRLGQADARAIRSECAETIARIEESVRVAWLPLELDVELSAAVEGRVGPDGLREWAREAIAHSARGPLLGPMLAALRRVGLTPHTALRRAPYAWSLVYRSCGEITYRELGPRGAVLTLAGAPGVMTGATYLRGIAGAWDGVATLGGGAEAFTTVDTSGGDVEFRCGWS